MAGRTRVVTIRMKQGGVLMIAPSAVMPWPRVLSRNARHLQPEILRRALSDPGAMMVLRREYPQLLNLPMGRSAGLMTSQALVREYLGAADRGLLTIIFGHVESTYGERPPGVPLWVTFEHHPAIARAVRQMYSPSFTERDKPQAQGLPIPNAFSERLIWTLARAPHFMLPADFARFREFFDPEGLATTAAILVIWGASHVVGVGFVVDAALFAQMTWQNGAAALRIFENLKQFFDLVRDPGGWNDLEYAAELFAAAITAMGVVGLRMLLRRVGSRTGARRGGEETQGAAPAKTGTPAKKAQPAAGQSAQASGAAGKSSGSGGASASAISTSSGSGGGSGSGGTPAALRPTGTGTGSGSGSGTTSMGSRPSGSGGGSGSGGIPTAARSSSTGTGHGSGSGGQPAAARSTSTGAGGGSGSGGGPAAARSTSAGTGHGSGSGGQAPAARSSSAGTGGGSGSGGVPTAARSASTGMGGGSGAGGPSAATPVGRSGESHRVQPGTNSPATIGGRDYSGHALDRMQERGVTPSVVSEAVKNGRATPGNRPDTTHHYDAGNNLTVITNKNGRVVTVREGK